MASYTDTDLAFYRQPVFEPDGCFSYLVPNPEDKTAIVNKVEHFLPCIDPSHRCAGSQFLEPDGWFPNHVPNPEDKTAMAASVNKVKHSLACIDPSHCCAGSQFLEPDGWFPNHVPNPEDKTAMAAGVHAVQQSSSDLGVVLDTDVDRSAVVARDGQPINSNRYIALMSLITLRQRSARAS